MIELDLLDDDLYQSAIVKPLPVFQIRTSVAKANPKDTLLLTYTQQCSFSFHRPFPSHSRVRRFQELLYWDDWEEYPDLKRHPFTKVSSGSSCRLKIWSQSRPRGWTSKRAIIGVRLTLGYRREKNRLVEEPAIAKMMDRNHMRGVSMESEVLSLGETEART
jgi:hypothetical protein